MTAPVGRHDISDADRPQPRPATRIASPSSNAPEDETNDSRARSSTTFGTGLEFAYRVPSTWSFLSRRQSKNLKRTGTSVRYAVLNPRRGEIPRLVGRCDDHRGRRHGSETNRRVIEAAGLSFILEMRIPEMPYVVKEWRDTSRRGNHGRAGVRRAVASRADRQVPRLGHLLSIPRRQGPPHPNSIIRRPARRTCRGRSESSVSMRSPVPDATLNSKHTRPRHVRVIWWLACFACTYTMRRTRC